MLHWARAEPKARGACEVPGQGAGAFDVGLALPFQHRRPALAEAVHVEDRNQVVDTVIGRGRHGEAFP